MDLGKIPKNYKAKFESVVSSPELESRLRREEDDAAHKRYKDKVILWAVVLSLGGVVVICTWVMLMVPGQPEMVKWATTLITTIVAAGVGYLTGKGSK